MTLIVSQYEYQERAKTEAAKLDFDVHSFYYGTPLLLLTRHVRLADYEALLVSVML